MGSRRDCCDCPGGKAVQAMDSERIWKRTHSQRTWREEESSQRRSGRSKGLCMLVRRQENKSEKKECFEAAYQIRQRLLP